MITSISFVVLSVFYSLIMCYVFLSKSHIKSPEIKMFKYLLLSNLIGLIMEIICYFSLKYYGINIYTILINKFFLLYFIIFIVLFSNYFISISFPEDFYKNNILKIKIASIFLFLVISILILTLPIYLSVENGIYSYGPATKVVYTVMTLSILFMMIIFFVRFKYINKKKFIPCIAFYLGGGAVGIIQSMNPSITLSTPMEMLVLFIMFFTIENPDMRMIEQLEIAKDQADKANQAKSEFLSNMSHEIRTPLNAIVGFSESLKDDEIPEDAKEKIEDIIMASNNLLEIVNGILDISKIEANKLEIINKEYETEPLFNELIALTNARIGDKGLEFKVSIDPAMPAVLYGDNARLKQIILNILTNAVKYTKEGFVDFKVSIITKGNVCRLIISVEDSGIGIKEEALPKLFSKFERLDVEKSLTIEGTGLGMAITKKLVDLMNGKIVVQSVYGKGSKFTVVVDQKIVSYEKQPVKEVKVSESKIISANGAKALIVDDNKLNIKVASVLLKRYKFDVDSANSGQECLDKIEAGNKYDIIFLDDMMPRMSGKETLSKLKKIEGFNIPVIALTANAITGMKQEYLNCGFNDYLSKPIETLELERVIKTYLNKVNYEEVNTKKTEVVSSIIPNNNLSLGYENYAGKKVLLVDDNELNLKVATMTLKKYNLDVTSVTNGSECIVKVIDNKYDLILLDELMPDLDGCKTLENLRSLEGFNTKVIMMTASKEDEVKEKLEKYAFDGYLGKPIVKEDLDDILKKNL